MTVRNVLLVMLFFGFCSQASLSSDGSAKPTIPGLDPLVASILDAAAKETKPDASAPPLDNSDDVRRARTKSFFENVLGSRGCYRDCRPSSPNFPSNSKLSTIFEGAEARKQKTKQDRERAASCPSLGNAFDIFNKNNAD